MSGRRRAFHPCARVAAGLLAAVCLPLVVIASAPPAGADLTGIDGTVYTFGTAKMRGSTAGRALAAPLTALTATPDGSGYWLVGADGGVFAFHAPFLGSLGGIHPAAPIVGLAPTPSGDGYWLAGADGGVFAFGDAPFLGSLGGIRLNAPVNAIVAGPGGAGYWLLAADGGVFAFGSAPFLGSTGGIVLNAPVVGMAATPAGDGYWLAAKDGGVFAFGAAPFEGSTGGLRLAQPVSAIASSGSGDGYWLAAEDGGVFSFGDAQFEGSAVGILPGRRHVVGIAGMPTGDGYRLLAVDRPPDDVALVGPGASGPGVVDLQNRLLALGFWLPGANGVFGGDTQQAVWAFQKWFGLPRTGTVDVPTRDAFRSAQRPTPRSTSGYLIEVDKARQVLIVANNGRADWVFNTSTGSDIPYWLDGVQHSAHTPEGVFTVVREVNGVAVGPLGALYRPKYFTWQGHAVHGYSYVPPFPASHGCVRVSNAAIDFIWAWNTMPLGTTVWVY